MARKLGNEENLSPLFGKRMSGTGDILIHIISDNQLPAVIYKWQVADIVENGQCYGLSETRHCNQHGI